MAGLSECKVIEGNLYLAGQRVPSGRYIQIESRNRRELWLDQEDILPASLDGRVACYRRIEPAWGEAPQKVSSPCTAG